MTFDSFLTIMLRHTVLLGAMPDGLVLMRGAHFRGVDQALV
jgi:hypothetical protein